MVDERIRVLVVDGKRRARQALRALLATWPDVVVVGEAKHADAALAQVEALRPEVVIMEARMPVSAGGLRKDGGGIVALERIRRRWPETQVIVQSLYGAYEQPALAAGATAFFHKEADPSLLLGAICRAVSRRRIWPGEDCLESEFRMSARQSPLHTHWNEVRSQVRRRFPRRIHPEDLDRIEEMPGRRAALCQLLAERCEELDENSADREIDSILDEISVTMM